MKNLLLAGFLFNFLSLLSTWPCDSFLLLMCLSAFLRLRQPVLKFWFVFNLWFFFFSVLTPYYAEEVLFSVHDLEVPNEDGVSILFYLQKIFPGVVESSITTIQMGFISSLPFMC